MTITVDELRDQMVDREAIRDCIYRYSRAVDRIDEDLLRSVYWEDAYDDHVLFQGDREALIAWVVPLLKRWDQSQHFIGNVFIRVYGDEAAAESYFQGFHRTTGADGKARDDVTGGRYVDRFEKRQGEWRVAHRVVQMDYFRNYDDSGDWSKFPSQTAKPGGRKPDDVSYSFFR